MMALSVLSSFCHSFRIGFLRSFVIAAASLWLLGPWGAAAQDDAARSWRAGDHHVHSHRSVNYTEKTDPPVPIAGTDADYPIVVNAMKARRYGLEWMVSTDHGGPDHSEYNLKQAYPELQRSRALVPGLMQFYGMEFDAPGANHTSLIIPKYAGEDSMLYRIERRFGAEEVHPEPPRREADSTMLDALRFMQQFPTPPVLFVNHPSRSDSSLRSYDNNPPSQLRRWNDTAPRVAVGMEGAPGHQGRLRPDGTVPPNADRGSYDESPTRGGFDKMTAVVGGVWDSLLGEGRRWWITSTSDSHHNWRDGGGDFWPGEYSKTYVYADSTYEDVLNGLREGRIFVTLGDLISELYVTADAPGTEQASIGGTLPISEDGTDVKVTIRVRDPDAPNHRGNTPDVQRVDLIVGRVNGPADDPATDTNPTTRVVRRFTAKDWNEKGKYLTMTHRLADVSTGHYLRVRGTNTDQREPKPDPLGENPWTDLWFYSNPIFLEVQ